MNSRRLKYTNGARPREFVPYRKFDDIYFNQIETARPTVNLLFFRVTPMNRVRGPSFRFDCISGIFETFSDRLRKPLILRIAENIESTRHERSLLLHRLTSSTDTLLGFCRGNSCEKALLVLGNFDVECEGLPFSSAHFSSVR